MPKTLVRLCSNCGKPCRFPKKWHKASVREMGVPPSGTMCSEDCIEADQEKRYLAQKR